jgi:hypothetical protein
MSEVMNVTTTSEIVKRGRPRRLEARVVGGDDLISALACGVDALSVDVARVSDVEASVCKMLDVSNELLERDQMGECDVEERERVRLERRRERDECKKEEKRLEREEKRLEREALKLEKKAAKEADKANARDAAKAAREETKAAKKAEKDAARDAAKAAREEAKAAKKAEKDAAREAAKAEKAAAKDAAKAAKVAAKEAAKAAKKAEKAEKKTNKTKKTVAPQLIAAVNAAPELLAAVADSQEDQSNGELVPQEFLTESGDSSEVPMMKQPSTGYEAPLQLTFFLLVGMGQRRRENRRFNSSLIYQFVTHFWSSLNRVSTVSHSRNPGQFVTHISIRYSFLEFSKRGYYMVEFLSLFFFHPGWK